MIKNLVINVKLALTAWILWRDNRHFTSLFGWQLGIEYWGFTLCSTFPELERDRLWEGESILKNASMFRSWRLGTLRECPKVINRQGQDTCCNCPHDSFNHDKARWFQIKRKGHIEAAISKPSSSGHSLSWFPWAQSSWAGVFLYSARMSYGWNEGPSFSFWKQSHQILIYWSVSLEPKRYFRNR